MDSRDSPSSTLQVNLSIDHRTTLEDPELTLAMHQIEKLWQNSKTHGKQDCSLKSINILGQAIKHIDHILKFVEGLAEVRVESAAATRFYTD